MADLRETIDTITNKMKKHRTFYEQNEMAVREQIVNPILRALGWNPENPENVQPNISTEEGVPDYSLLKNNKKVLFIEAKKLSIDIEHRDIIRQLAKYCFGEGMKYGVLTNGGIWTLFRAFQEDTTVSERIVWRTDIENDETTAIIRKLSTISKENITDIENLIKKLYILDEIWHSLLNEPKNLIKGFVPIFNNLIKEGYPEYEFVQTEIEEFIQERIKELIFPTQEIIADSISIESSGCKTDQPRIMKIETDTYEIRKSYEILVNTAEWLIKKGKLRKENCPITSGSRRNLVNTQPKHRYGNDFIAPKRLSNGLYIETNHSTISCIINAHKLLKKFRYHKDILELQ